MQKTEITESYKRLLDLDDQGWKDYNDLMSKTVDIISRYKHHDILRHAIFKYHSMFPCFDDVKQYINLNNFHEYFDKSQGDMRLGWVIERSRNLNLSSVAGYKAFIADISYIADMMIKTGNDFNVHSTQRNFAMQCDFFLILHNRNYAFCKNYKIEAVNLDLIRSIVLMVIKQINENHNTVDTSSVDLMYYPASRKTKITIPDRKRQLTSCKLSMQKYSPTFDTYLMTIYSTVDIDQDTLKKERKSYFYYLHKFGLHSSNRPGRPAKKSSKIITL
jgi:hypothetical protein